MKMKKAARARARDAIATAMAPKQPSAKYATWKFIFQGKVIKTHQSPKKNATNIGNLPQMVGSSNNPNELHNKGLLAIKRHVRQRPQTRKAHGMCKLPTKPRLVPCRVSHSAKNHDKKIAPQKRGKIDRAPSQEAILHPNLDVREAQKNGQGNALDTIVRTCLMKHSSPSRLDGGSQNNQEKTHGVNEFDTSYMAEDAGKMLVDWATFDFNAAIFIQGNNPIISSYETQYESRYETQYEGMQMEIDVLSFSDVNLDSYYIIPNYEATDDMLVSLWD